MDLLILACVAAFILYRLYMTLGERTGFDASMKKQQETVVSLSKARAKKADLQKELEQFKNVPTAARSGLQAIAKQDPEFNLPEFIEGASDAFTMIIEAFAKEDLKSLQDLLGAELYGAFEGAIEDRRSQGLKLENTIIKIDSVKVTSAQMVGKTARIGLEFTSEQVPIMRNESDEIVEGNPQQIDQIIDSWVFERDTRSEDPNWRLVQTEE